MSTIPADEYEYEYSSETHQIYSFGQMCKLSHGLTTYYRTSADVWYTLFFAYPANAKNIKNVFIWGNVWVS